MATAASLSLWFILLILKSAQALASNDCPPLPYAFLTNGHIIRAGPRHIRFKCEPGYYVSGPTETICHEGNWTSARAPVCFLAGTCDPVPHIPNAYIYRPPQSEVGSMTHYICHPGHFMLGNRMRMCLESGFWSGITPACINESEPLQDVADRLGREFVTKMSAHTGSVQQKYYLDRASLRRGLELVILVDRSSSVDPYDLNIAKNFMKFLFREFDIRNGDNEMGTRTAVIAFGDTVDILINLNDTRISSPARAGAALDGLLLPNGGGTAMVPAFMEIVVKLAPILRQKAKLALFLISDGEPNVDSTHITPEDMTSILKENGFEIFAVGIGPDVNKQLLANIASKPIINHVFLLKKYSDLNGMMNRIQNKPSRAPPIRPEKCGHFNPVSSDTKWPWMAAVYVSHETDNSTKLNLCGGVLICSQWVLTAASCFFHVHRRDVSLNLKDVFVVLGEDNLIREDENQRNFYAVDVQIHPDFDQFNALANNLALVKLNDPASVRKFRPVCLPPVGGVIPLHLNREINATLAGWGPSPIIYEGFIVPSTNPRFHLAVKLVDITENIDCMEDQQTKMEHISIFCTESSYADASVGNLGSPVVAQDPKTDIYHVLGLMSHKKKGFTLNVDLRSYNPWISETTDNCHAYHSNKR